MDLPLETNYSKFFFGPRNKPKVHFNFTIEFNGETEKDICIYTTKKDKNLSKANSFHLREEIQKES